MWRSCILLALLAGARAQIHIVYPHELQQQLSSTNGVIFGATSAFGTPTFGERLLGKLKRSYIKDTRDCISKESLYVHNSQFTAPVASDPDGGGESYVAVYLLKLTQSCPPREQVKLAEKNGAHAVILITDNTNLSPQQVAEYELPSGGGTEQTNIPSILISAQHGDLLWSEARRGAVIVELAWDIPQALVVTTGMWMSSGSLDMNLFLRNFKDSAEVLGHKMQFVPHYYVFDLPPGVDVGDMCSDKLSGEVRHCAPDPDGEGPVTGADVANEDLRQLCLWIETAKESESEPMLAKYSQEWWDYVASLYDECPMDAVDHKDRFGSAICSFRLMHNLGVSVDNVRQCSTYHGVEHFEEQVAGTAWSEQAVQINGWKYQGPFDAEVVLRAVCAGYAEEPVECTELLSESFIFKTLLATIRHIGRGDAVSVRLFVITIMAIVALTVVNCYLYRRHLTKLVRTKLREEVMLEVQSRMSDYSRLEGTA